MSKERIGTAAKFMSHGPVVLAVVLGVQLTIGVLWQESRQSAPATGTFDALKVRELTLVDENGVEVGRWSSSELGPRLTLLDKEGRPAVVIAARARGGGSVVANTPENGSVAMDANDMPRFEVIDGKRRKKGAFQVTNVGSPEVLLYDGDSDVRVGLGVYHDGKTASVTIYSRGYERAIELFADDAEGEVVRTSSQPDGGKASVVTALKDGGRTAVFEMRDSEGATVVSYP